MIIFCYTSINKDCMSNLWYYYAAGYIVLSEQVDNNLKLSQNQLSKLPKLLRAAIDNG